MRSQSPSRQTVLRHVRRHYEMPGDGERSAAFKRGFGAQLQESPLWAVSHAVSDRGAGPRMAPAGRRFAMIAIAVLLTTGVAMAAGAPTDLGRPHDAAAPNPYFPLSGFHRMSTNLRQFGQPELLFLPWREDANRFRTTIDHVGRAEVWPLVKALDQFGTLSRVKVLDRDCHVVTVHVPGEPSQGTVCSLPTFDLTHAVYRSRYLRLVVRPLVLDARSNKLKLGSQLSAAEQRVYKKECTPPAPGCQFDDLGVRRVPLIGIGNYVQTSSQFMISGLFSAPPVATPGPNSQEALFDFATIRDALLRSQDPPEAKGLVESINAEANVMIALICHADGKRPMSICNQSVIKRILKHVR